MKLHKPEHIAAIVPYVSGRPMDEVQREYGITDIIKLASNENPWGASPQAISAIREQLESLHRYPDASSYAFTQVLAEWTGVEPAKIVLGNGSNELIELLVKAFVQPGDEVVTSYPSFLMYQKFVQIHGGKNVVVKLREMRHDLEAIQAVITPRTRLLFMDNPNNPTGTLLDREHFDTFLRSLSEEVIVVLDEAYVDFVAQDHRIDIPSYIDNPANIPAVVSLRTFSKAFGLAGLRAGFGIMPEEIAQLLHRVRQPFNINLLAQVGCQAAVQDKQHYAAVIARTSRGLQWLRDEVERLGCRSYPSQANFFLIDVGGDATSLCEAMLAKGVIVRSMQAYGYSNCIRVTVGTDKENKRFIKTLDHCRRELGYGQ